MQDRGLREIHEFLGSAHIFASAVSDVIEERLLKEVSGWQVTVSQLNLLKLVSLADSHTLGDVAAYDAARQHKLASVFTQFPREELSRASELLDRLSAGIVDHSSNPEEFCLKCGIYFRERCLVRQLVRRNCYNQRHKQRPDGRPEGEAPSGEGTPTPA